MIISIKNSLKKIFGKGFMIKYHRIKYHLHHIFRKFIVIITMKPDGVIYKKKQIYQPLQFIGTNYGGWYFNPKLINMESVIYAVGVGEDISFDLGIINSFGCTVYAFDPTPRTLKWLKNKRIPDQFIFFPYGLAKKEGSHKMYLPKNITHTSYTLHKNKKFTNEYVNVPMKKLSSIITTLKTKKIDILKLDIEGTEYEIIDDIINSPIPIIQLLIEFHHRFDNIGSEETNKAIKKLNSAGYKIYKISPSELEYSFIKQN